METILLPTYTGRRIDLLHLRPEDIVLEDIARPLAMIPRYLGHSIRPLSVAEHSVRMTHATRMLHGGHLMVEALLHDAHEAYTGELPRMLKHADLLCGYRSIQDMVDRVIRERFGLFGTMPDEIAKMDRAICRLEIHSGVFPKTCALLRYTGNGTVAEAERMKPAFRNKPFAYWGWDWKVALELFMKTAKELGVE